MKLEEFLSNKSPKQPMGVFGEPTQQPPASMAPVDNTKLDFIKQTYSLNSPNLGSPSSPSQSPYSPVAKSDLIDVDKVRSQAASMMPERGWQDAIPALAPLALEALFGGGKSGGVSYGIAGKGLMDIEEDRVKRQRGLEDKLMEIEKARAIASAKKSSDKLQAKPIRNKITGESFIGSYDPSTGNTILPNGEIASMEEYEMGTGLSGAAYGERQDISTREGIKKAESLGMNVKQNPTTGEWEAFVGGKPTKVGPSGEFNVKQSKDAEKMVGEFTKSPAYQDSVQSLAITPTVTSLLNAAQRTNNPNSIAGNSVVLTMIRQAQRVGVASDRDAAALGGTQQWGETINRLTNKLLGTGENLTIRDIQELREISEIYKKRSQKLLGDFYSGEKKAYSKRYGLTPEQVESQLGPKVNPFMSISEKAIQSSSLPEGIEFGGSMQYPPKSNERATVPFSLDGKLYWAEPSNIDEVVKKYPKAKRLK